MMSQSMNVSVHGFGRLFQKDVVESAIGRRDEDGEAWEGGHVFLWGEANPVTIFIFQPALQSLNDQCSILY